MHLDNVHYCAAILYKVCQYWWYKIAASATVIIFTFFFDPDHKKVLASLFALLIIDFITGVIAAKMKNEPIQSHKIFRSAIKVAVYFTLVSAGRISEAALSPIPFIDETIIGFLTATELVSIIENVAKMGYGVPIGLLEKLKQFTGNKHDKKKTAHRSQ